MRQRKRIPPAPLKQLRYEYEETNTPIGDLAVRAGMSRQTFHKCVRELGWSMRVPGRGGAGHSTPLSTFEGKRQAAAKARPRKSNVGKVPSEQSKSSRSDSAPPPDAAGVALDRRTLAARIQKSIERELAAIERVLDLLKPRNGNEAERAARTLAALARTLREVATLDTTTSAESHADDDAGPRDMDEFRRDLARQIDAIIAGRNRSTGRDAEA